MSVDGGLGALLLKASVSAAIASKCCEACGMTMSIVEEDGMLVPIIVQHIFSVAKSPAQLSTVSIMGLPFMDAWALTLT